MIYHFNVGRLTVGVFWYWIGFSWRKVGGMGRVCDAGFLKFVYDTEQRTEAKRG